MSQSEPSADPSPATDAAKARKSTRVVFLVLGVSLLTPVMAIVLGAPVMYRSFKTPAGSMMPTIFVGDIFFARRAVPSKAHGAIVVFPYPEAPDQSMVKRVLGRGGDRLIFGVDGSVRINDWPIPRCLVGKTTFERPDEPPASGEIFLESLGGHRYLVFEQTDAPEPTSGTFTVPPGELFVVGDNRRNSHDSRMYNHGAGGGIPERTVEANPWRVWRPGPEAGGALSWRAIDRPWLSPSMNGLAGGLDKCLASAPPLDATTPPGL